MLAIALSIMLVFSVSERLCNNSFSSVWRPVLLLYVLAIACSVGARGACANPTSIRTLCPPILLRLLW